MVAFSVRGKQACKRAWLREVREPAVATEGIVRDRIVVREAQQPLAHRLNERPGQALRKRRQYEHVAGPQQWWYFA